MASSSGAIRTAGLFGLLAVAAIPAGVAAAQWRADVGLLQGLYVGVGAALVLACVALIASRRARLARSRSIAPAARGIRPARILAWAGLYAGVTGGIALIVYSVLRWAQ